MVEICLSMVQMKETQNEAAHTDSIQKESKEHTMHTRMVLQILRILALERLHRLASWQLFVLMLLHHHSKPESSLCSQGCWLEGSQEITHANLGLSRSSFASQPPVSML